MGDDAAAASSKQHLAFCSALFRITRHVNFLHTPRALIRFQKMINPSSGESVRLRTRGAVF